MARYTEESKGTDSGNLHNREGILVLSVDKNGKILRFNKECELMSGNGKKEVLNRQLFDFLIPERHVEQWEEIFDYAKRNKPINDFELPILTQRGPEAMISWSAFPARNAGGLVESIAFMGRLISHENDVKKSSVERKEKRNLGNKTDREPSNKKNKNRVLFASGNKRLVLGGGAHRHSKSFRDATKTKVPPKREKKTTNSKKDRRICKVKVGKKKLNKKHKEQLGDYNNFKKTIKKLKEINEELKKENKKLGKKVVILKTRLTDGKVKQQRWDKTRDLIEKKTVSSFNRAAHFLFDCTGVNRKNDEFERMMHELNERRSLLDDFESQIVDDKNNLADRRNEFCKWREKLEMLEEEITRRRVELAKQEQKFDEYIVSSLSGGVREWSSTDPGGKVSSDVGDLDAETVEHFDSFDKIPKCAAIIQRGKFKQVNQSFAELFGYNAEEIVEESLFDFVVSEGFSDIEKYYLRRLKGEKIDSYVAMFHTKQNGKMAMEVSTEPINYRGEKAEIAVFKKLTDSHKDAIAADKVEDEKGDASVSGEPGSKPEENAAGGEIDQDQISDLAKKVQEDKQNAGFEVDKNEGESGVSSGEEKPSKSTVYGSAPGTILED